MNNYGPLCSLLVGWAIITSVARSRPPARVCVIKGEPKIDHAQFISLAASHSRTQVHPEAEAKPFHDPANNASVKVMAHTLCTADTYLYTDVLFHAILAVGIIILTCVTFKRIIKKVIAIGWQSWQPAANKASI